VFVHVQKYPCLPLKALEEVLDRELLLKELREAVGG